MFSNISDYSYYLWVSPSDIWQNNNGISLCIKIPLWLVGGFWAAHCLKWWQKENVGENLFLAQVLKPTAIVVHLCPLSVPFLMNVTAIFNWVGVLALLRMNVHSIHRNSKKLLISLLGSDINLQIQNELYVTKTEKHDQTVKYHHSEITVSFVLLIYCVV